MSRTQMKRRIQRKNKKVIFDKYALYNKAVQSTEADIEFIYDVFKELKSQKPRILREDFCGTGALIVDWGLFDKKNIAYGVDLDPEPMEYGRHHYLSKLPLHKQKRIHYLENNVLNPRLPKADVVTALNFSYFIFKKREIMKKYFKNVLKTLNAGGLFIIDVFGGTQCYDKIEDVTRHKGFTYYWDQTGFDPVNNEALFYIHFRVKGKKIEKVFSYDWRMWSLPELRDILIEAGFAKTHIYWEGTTKAGTGNGIFSRTEQGEACLSWVAYIVSEK